MRSSIKRILVLLLVFVLVICISVAIHVNNQIGDRYTEAVSQRRFTNIPYYDKSLNEFISPENLIMAKEKTTGGNPGFLRFFKRSPYAPNTELPIINLERLDFSMEPDDFAVYWFGHSTALIELDGHRILMDPVFENAGPLPGITKRFGNSPAKREGLPNIEVLIITHDHYDHLEANTIKYFALMDIKFIVPLGGGARLVSWGVPENKIIELGWHENYKFGSTEITACPAVHYSGRSNKDKNKTLWASYVIKGSQKTLFWSGDTGYSNHFKQIGSKYGPFDVVFVEIDAWNKG